MDNQRLSLSHLEPSYVALLHRWQQRNEVPGRANESFTSVLNLALFTVIPVQLASMLNSLKMTLKSHSGWKDAAYS